jgi:hypothetical protein
MADEIGVLPEKLAGDIEKVFVDFDFNPLFNTGVTITPVNPSAISVCGGGPDTTPQSMLVGTPQISNGVVSQLYKGGNADTQYLLTVGATGDDGSAQVIQLILPVVAKRIG